MTLSGFALALGLLGVAPLALVLTVLRVILRRPKIEVHWSDEKAASNKVLTVRISNEPTGALVKTLGVSRRSIGEMFCGATI